MACNFLLPAAGAGRQMNPASTTAMSRVSRHLSCAPLALILCAGTVSAAALRLEEETLHGLPHFKITTSAATYWLEQTGAGLSRMTDRDSRDWLGFEPAPGSGAAGEFRGFPNAVHQQAGNYFHPRNKATDPSTVIIEERTGARVIVRAESGNGLWACRYEFTDAHCTFTMTRMPADKRYWVLYEGTPGGSFENTDWWMTSAITTPQPITTNHEGDIPAPEWIFFGDAASPRVLFLLHHEDDAHPDRFYAMQSKMTVFGFGRQGIQKHLDRVPQRFTLGFLETTHHATMRDAMAKLLAAP
jgi:hypothetical protein